MFFLLILFFTIHPSIHLSRLPKGMEQFYKQVEGILSVDDVDRLSEKINSVGKEFRIEQYFEVKERFIITII